MNIVHFKEHRGVEKEESSSYLSQFLCLDNVGHHSASKHQFSQFLALLSSFDRENQYV